MHLFVGGCLGTENAAVAFAELLKEKDNGIQSKGRSDRRI